MYLLDFIGLQRLIALKICKYEIPLIPFPLNFVHNAT